MWTNSTLRKELGERGFFEVPDSIVEVVPDKESEGHTYRTAWTRFDKLIYFITRERGEPTIEDSSGTVLDLDSLGYRNPHSAPGWQAP